MIQGDANEEREGIYPNIPRFPLGYPSHIHKANTAEIYLELSFGSVVEVGGQRQ